MSTDYSAPQSAACQALLARLEKVRSCRPGSWLACCPAHDDHLPSLSIREAEQGTLLLHCFAGCSVPAIVSAIGLELSDLFPPRLNELHHRPKRKPTLPWPQVLQVLRRDIYYVAIAAHSQARGYSLQPTEKDELNQISERLLTLLGVE